MRRAIGCENLMWREKLNVNPSRMHLALMGELNRRSMFPLMDQKFPLIDENGKQTATFPDFYFPDKHHAIYIDGDAVHKHRRKRDEELRMLLEKQYHVKVSSFNYPSFSKKEKARLLNLILEAIR